MELSFNAMQTRLVLEGLITQIIIPFNEELNNISAGDVCGISFGGIFFKNYQAEIIKKSVTSLQRVTSEDMFKNGFLYKPFFFDFMRDEYGVNNEDTVVKLDFKLIEGVC